MLDVVLLLSSSDTLDVFTAGGKGGGGTLCSEGLLVALNTNRLGDPC